MNNAQRMYLQSLVEKYEDQLDVLEEKTLAVQQNLDEILEQLEDDELESQHAEYERSV